MLLYSTFSYGNDKNLHTLIISFLNIIVKHKKIKTAITALYHRYPRQRQQKRIKDRQFDDHILKAAQ